MWEKLSNFLWNYDYMIIDFMKLFKETLCLFLSLQMYMFYLTDFKKIMGLISRWTHVMYSYTIILTFPVKCNYFKTLLH